MPRRYELKDMDLILAQVRGQNARAAITVGASCVAHALEQLLQSRLRSPQTNREKEVLFSDFGILGSFSEQIWMSYFMNLIGPKTRHDLDILRIIRNVAAHDMNPVSFDDEPISSRLSTLTILTRLQPGAPAPEPEEHRFKFLTAVNLYSANLLLRSVDVPELRHVVCYLDD